MAVGKGFLDQYSVFCVFGSVVGCVVVPLITQSIESVIFSAIVISLTATHLSKRAVNTDSSKLHGQPHKDSSLRKSKDNIGNKKKSPKKAVVQVEMQVRSSDFRQKKEQKIRRIEEAKKLEEQRKQEEKRERKAKKKEEKLKQKEEKKLLEEGERRRKQKGEKSDKPEKPTSPVNGRRKTKTKCHVNTSQKGVWITASSTRGASSRKPNAAPMVANNSVVTPLNAVSAGDALYHEKPSSPVPDSCDAKPPSPPPSVWKVPEYVPPQWNPDKQEERVKGSHSRCHERLNNDVVLEQRKRPTTPFNQLRNPVVSSQKFKNQYMNQDVSKTNMASKDSDPNLLVDVPLKFTEKADNRTQASSSPYSNITGLPSFFKSTTETHNKDSPDEKTYSLFGPEEPNRVLFQPLFQRDIHAT